MTDAVQLAIIAAIPPTVAALAALVVSWRNSVKSDAISAKTDVIHALANDNLSKATNAVAVANETIKGQQAMITSLTEAKRVKASKIARTPSRSKS